MAPALTTDQPVVAHQSLNHKAPINVFPDGIRTSGQLPPDYTKLSDYGAFPVAIDGPTVWESKDYVNNPERWTHLFSEEEISELSIAADNFLQSSTPLTGITKVKYLRFYDHLINLH